MPVYFLHGFIGAGDESRLLITETDYIRFRDRRETLFSLLKEQFAQSTFLYVGYSNRDQNWKTLLDEVQREFSPKPTPLSYRLTIDEPSMADALLEARNVYTLHCSLSDFCMAARAQLHAVEMTSSALEKLERDIPPDFAEDFTDNPVAVARFFNSWQYVNQCDFSQPSNAHAFLRGDRPNWGLIAQKHFFQRDVEDPLYDEMLDYATSGALRESLTLLGHAGSGVTTVLMSLAARLVREGAGPVYFLRPGAQVLEGDVLFVAQRDPHVKPFFFVDNAAIEKERLRRLVQRVQSSHANGMLVLGARLNEWRESTVRLATKERQLLQLGPDEIPRLLTLLENSGELGVLADLSPELRVVKIQQSNSNDLLVTLREVTEGRSFDAIIEDEYLGIHSELGRRFYLMVACFFQKHLFVRDTLLARLLDVDTEEMFRETNAATEGVVLYETVDEANGVFAARARHRVIAQIVWERCGSRTEREDLLLRAMSFLNLAYKWDRDAFDLFVRSDELVDFFGTLEKKTRYFDTAINKDPDNPYVRQHYARMLSREGRDLLALSQINEALSINSNPRALHHTKGLILAQLALGSPSPDVGRRYLLQAEDAFNTCIQKSPRDDYGYTGLAHLYLEWAKRCENVDDATGYTARAESLISDGLRRASIHESLWLESARVEAYLGDSEARIQALEKAHGSSPSSPIAAFLLARAYRRDGRAAEAEQLLQPIIQTAVEEFRVFIEYAKCLIALGKPYKEAAAVLRLAYLSGLSDPRYIATLGGMLCLGKDYTAALDVFSESAKRGFSLGERTRIFYRPRIDGRGDRIRLTGRISSVKGNYAFIIAADFGTDVFCPRSRLDDVLTTEGTFVEFDLAFSSRGPIADSISLAPKAAAMATVTPPSAGVDQLPDEHVGGCDS